MACCVAVLAVLAGCAGGEERPPPKAPEPAASAEQFTERFAKLTGVHLEPVPGDAFGTRLDVPEEPDRFVRFGVYSLVWTRERSDREVLLGDRKPDRRGIHWQGDGEGWSANKPFGPHLVLQWTGGSKRVTAPEWDRLERAVRAAYLGDSSLLPAPERPCADARLDPLRGRPGSCSVDGMPVTFTDADQPLATEALSARVLGVETADEIGEGTLAPTEASGRYVIVGYRVRNESSRPFRFLETQLRIGGRSVREDAGAGVLLPSSRRFPLPPGETIEARAAFDVEPSLAERARREGAFILPGALDDGDPSPDLTQGWIRLAQAPPRLGEPPRPPLPPGAPPPQPEPTGPPPIDVDEGDGPPIGGTTRRLYTANTYFPVPKDFVAGGVRTGTRARDCRVPRPSRRDRAELYAATRRSTPAGRVRPLLDRQVLLADCAQSGRWAMVSWELRGTKKGLVLNLDDFVRRRGRWVGTPEGEQPGCRLPKAVAAAWALDVSICDRTPGGRRRRRAGGIRS